MSEVVGEVWVAVRPETAGFGPALSRDVSASATAAGAKAGREAGSSFSRSFGSAVRTGAAVIGIAGAFEEVRRSIGEAAAHTGEVALLAQATHNAGVANEFQGQSLEALIKQQALQRGFIDEELYPAYTRLVSATHSNALAYRDLGLAEDIARQRHIDVGVAALALAKAEQGSVTSLQRLGIILPLHVRQLTGAAKATAALEVVQQRFAGSADRFAASGAGALQRFAEARHLIEEAVGAAILPQVEHAALATANWASKSENLARVERDVGEAAHVIEGGVKGAVKAFEAADRAISPVVHLLGGYDKAAELVFGLVALRKLQAITVAAGKWAKTVTVGETAAAAATAREAAATTAATAASERQAVVDGVRAEALAGVAAAETGAAAATGSGAVAAGLASPKFLSLAASGRGLAGVMRSGVAPAVVLAGYELSTFIRKIPGWESGFESLGAKAESLAGKLGLIHDGGGINAASAQAGGTLNQTDVQQRLAAAYQQALKEIPHATADFEKQARDKIVAGIVGPGYTFHDAQVFAADAARQAAQRAAGLRPGTAGQRRNYDPASVATAARTGRPTDADYQLAVARAQAASDTRAELDLYQQRAAYLTKRIDRLKADGDLTAAQKAQELRLYNERQQVEDSITQIHKDAVEAAKARADKERQVYQDSVSAREQVLQLAEQRAQLDTTSSAAARKADVQLVAFYRQEAVDVKLTGQQRAQYASQVVATEQAIQQIDQQALQTRQQAYRDSLSLEEQKLQLAAKRAELTQKSVRDDKAAARKLIAFYTREAHDARLTEAERLQYASQAIDERIALRNLTRGAGKGASLQSIFGEAASEFRSYGSNIAGRNGVLSGQDERARFSQLLLQGHRVRLNADGLRHLEQLTELQRQTALLQSSRDLLARIAGPSHTRRPAAAQIEKLRKTHGIVGVN